MTTSNSSRGGTQISVPGIPLLVGVTQEARLANISRSTFYRWLLERQIPENCLLRLDGHHLKIRVRAWCDWLEGDSPRCTHHGSGPKSTL